jgi:hypothetical protein
MRNSLSLNALVRRISFRSAAGKLFTAKAHAHNTTKVFKSEQRNGRGEQIARTGPIPLGWLRVMNAPGGARMTL